ncbi:MAG TPA: Txe/YoeB family addiction module toxin [Chitinophagales bacterium]|nr:Txe/YoeB family addiction module toxin [Chitinophagales bacterium]
MRNVSFAPRAFDQFIEWREDDDEIFQKIVRLIQETRREPFTGTGKPEPLKYELKGYWSRRINLEHRIVYKVTENSIDIISCKHHY